MKSHDEDTPQTVCALAHYLLNPSNRISVVTAFAQAPDEPGIYAIFATDSGALPAPFRQYLADRGHSCVYVGKTSHGQPSLKRRLVQYDLTGGGDSTFFCSLGVVLGYRPAPGSLIGKKDQNNFRFSPREREEIASWTKDHLAVVWRVLTSETVDDLEAPLIRRVRPLLNLQHNPSKLAKLEEFRRRARDIARGVGPRRARGDAGAGS